MTNYIGKSPGVKKFFYGLRRSNAGELTFSKLDFEGGFGETIVFNDLEKRSDQEEQYDFPGFDEDYFEGRNENHELVNQSLNYEQYKFREEDLYYYIDETDGHLVVRINDEYIYPEQE